MLFEACSQGRLLLLEPKIDVFEREDIEKVVHRKSPIAPIESDRYRFLALNEIARMICQ